MPRDWDATTYERLSAPMTAMGTDVLDRLILRGDETVLDAGCGTGGVTRLLHDRLPDGHVIAVDGAPSMVEEARALSRRGQRPLRRSARARARGAGGRDPLDRDVPLDPRPRAALPRLRAALAPGGRLVAQCGGHGNVAAIKRAGLDVAGEAPYAGYFDGWATDWQFATPEDTERRLRAAGFTDVWCWLSRVDVDPGDPVGYLRAICLGSFLPRLPEALREPFVADALARLPDPLVIHYVRLNILART